MTVSGLSPGVIDTSNFGLETVCINLTHTWDSDLMIELVSPDGTSSILSANNGGADDNYLNTCFNENAPTAITSAWAPFTGTFRPQGQMGRVNNGQAGNGIWRLRITDQVAGDAGTLMDWNITFGNNPAGYNSFHDSNLPIVVINTNGLPIPNDPKIMADLGIVYNGVGMRNALTDSFNHYNGKVGIEVRGSSSSGFPKKPYGIELWDNNSMAIDSPLLGMPAESDWVLNPSYADKTLLRNALAFRLGEQTGMYAPRGQHVELILNGEHMGVYYFCEKIKRDDNRLDIAKLTVADTVGDDLTGGYILKVDKLTGSNPIYWNSLFPPADAPGGNPVEIILDYPNVTNAHPKQVDYIHDYLDSFELALAGPNFQDTTLGYRHFADIESFANYFIFTELTRNVDGFRSSAFLYKDKASNGGKLKMGPPWDYDLSMGNGDFCGGHLTSGWVYQFNSVCPGDGWLIPFWWKRMLEDSVFVQAVRCRWEALKTNVFSPASINLWLDSAATYLDEGQTRNFQVWPILGTYVWPNFYIAADYQGEIDTLKWFIAERFAWIDANLPGNPNTCNLVGLASALPALSLQAWPNPTNGRIRLAFQGDGGSYHLRVMDLQGHVVQAKEGNSMHGPMELEWDLDALSSGLYMIELLQEDRRMACRVRLTD